SERTDVDHPDRADLCRRGRDDDGPLRAGAGARRLRPGDPPADRARGLLAPALHGDGDARAGGAAPGRLPGRRGGTGDRAAEVRDDRRLMAISRGVWKLAEQNLGGAESARESRASGVFVTGTSTEVGKTVVAAALARTLAGEGKGVAVFKPAVTGAE